jgi:uncharacterized membrane-anchored protein
MLFVLVTTLPNLQLLKIIFRSDDILFSKKIAVVLSLTGSIQTNFTALEAIYTVILAILFGIYVSMLIYFINNRVNNPFKTSMFTGLLGPISGFVGIGCMTCGTFLLTSLIPLSGIVVVSNYLPVYGEVLGLFGIIILITSIYFTAKKIDSNVCVIKN